MALSLFFFLIHMQTQVSCHEKYCHDNNATLFVTTIMTMKQVNQACNSSIMFRVNVNILLVCAATPIINSYHSIYHQMTFYESIFLRQFSMKLLGLPPNHKTFFLVLFQDAHRTFTLPGRFTHSAQFQPSHTKTAGQS